MASIRETSVNDLCRCCGKNLRIHGVISISVLIFEPGYKSRSTSILQRLVDLGVALIPDIQRSIRLCKSCCSLIGRLERDLPIFRKWQQEEDSLTSETQPRESSSSAGDKRERSTPSKTPRAVKKICRTPATTVTRRSITQVITEYASKTVVKVSSPSEAGIIQHITNKNWKTAANLISTHKELYGELKSKILTTISEESQCLSTPNNNFVLWKSSPEDLKFFSFDKLLVDLENMSPFLMSIFQSVSGKCLPAACAALCIALRGREPRMSAFAYYVNSILHHGGVKKAAFKRLSKMAITTSYTCAIGKQKELAATCGERLQELKVSTELYLTSEAVGHPVEIASVNMEDFTLSDDNTESRNVFSQLPVSETAEVNTPPPATTQPEPPPTYSIIMDNLDFFMKAHQQSSLTSNKSLHWIHHIAVEDRIQISNLSDVRPDIDITTYNLSHSLPGSETQAHMRREFIVLGSRILIQHLHVFKPLSKAMLNHIPHKYSEEMSLRSTEYPLGLLFKNENKTGDLIDVLSHLQKEYVPRGPNGLEKVLVGGDRLTEGNCRNLQWTFRGGATEEERLEGLAFRFEDWHAIRNLLEIHYKIFFNKTSSKDHGTLFSNMNVLRCSNAKQGPTAAHDAYKHFLRKDTAALFLAAALEHFGLEGLSDRPHNFIPADIESGSQADQRTWLHDKTGELIDKYVMLLGIFGKADDQPTAQFQCREPECDKAYISPEARQMHEKKKHNLVLSSPPSPSTTTALKSDSIKEHSEARLGFSFVLLNMMDAVKEGDGQRLMRLYQVALLFYKAYGHSQYAYSTLLLTLQLNATLSPRMAHSLKWNRFWNGRGGAGNNIPLDLHLEHMNNYLKSFLKGLGPNLNETSADRISKSIGILKEMMDNTDRELEVTKPSGVHHTSGEEQDIATLVAIFKDRQLFHDQPGREYQSFPSFGKDLLGRLQYANLYLWMQAKIKDWRKVAV